MTRPSPLGLILPVAAALAAPPAAAQQTQAPVAGISPPGSCRQALALTRFLSAPIDAIPADPILFSISRFEPQYVEFSLSRAIRTAIRGQETTGGDPVLTLYDTSGAVVVWNDDEEGSLNAFIDTELPAGLYCLQVRALGDTPQADVGVEVTIATGDAAAALAGGGGADDGGVGGDPDMACGDPARTASLGAEVAPGMGRRAVTGEVEARFFRDIAFTVRQAVTVQADLTSGEFDTVLELYDGAGNFIDSNDDSPAGGTDSRLTLTLQPGSYCARVTGFEGAGGAFELALTDQPDQGGTTADGGQGATGPCGDPATTADAGPVGPGFGRLALPARVPPMSRQDWRLAVSLSGEVEFAAVSGELDTVLMLFDGAGNLVAENDDISSAETNSRFTARLSPGTYCLRLEGFGGASGLAEVSLRDLAGGGVVDSGGGNAGGGSGGSGGAVVLPPPGSFAFEDVGVVMGTALANAPSADATKWVGFTLPENDDVQVNAISLSGSFALRLFAQDGTLIDSATGSGSMASARITATLAAGVYYIGMTLDDPAVPNKLRTITISR